MEIGSFIELDLKYYGEYFNDGLDVCRLNTGRSAILHACKLYNTDTLYLPYYICPSVRDFLLRHEINIKYYNIDNNFEPILHANEISAAIIIVNYFGLFSQKKIARLTRKYNNIIIDNSQAFFAPPFARVYSVYSARKFFGVPDGSYLIGKDASSGSSLYEKDNSSQTSAFLLKRLEKGCKAVYKERMQNERRLDNSGILSMSELTRKLLRSIDYEDIRNKRRQNFIYANEQLKNLNLLDLTKFMDETCIPMVYPLVVKDELLMEKLKKEEVFTGRWWNSVLKSVHEDSFEAFLTKYMVPIPIDQRYGKVEIDHIFNILCRVI